MLTISREDLELKIDVPHNPSPRNQQYHPVSNNPSHQKLHIHPLDKEYDFSVLPQMFNILHTNMTKIAPTGCSYEEDESIWLSYAIPQLKQAYPAYILAFWEDTLTGYFQYSITNDVLTIHEVQIHPEFQRTLLFYRLCCYICEHIPKSIRIIEAYINKQNHYALKISQKLGFEIIGETVSGRSWHLRGNVEASRAIFKKKHPTRI